MPEFIPQFTPRIREKDIQAVTDQMKSGWVGPSSTTTELEDLIKKKTGAKYCLLTTSGTTALMIAIRALGLGSFSNILFPSYTFLAGANAAKFLKHRVQLVDIDRDTLCMDPKYVKNAIDTKRIDCVMFVNHNAYVGDDVALIAAMCEEREIPMIEDASQALGMPHAGLTGDIGVFSFSVPKVVTTGQGGAIVTDRAFVFERARQIRDHGEDWRKTKIHEHLGVNFKFNDILAAYGKSQIEDLDDILAERKRIFDRYRRNLSIIDYGYDSTWMVLYRCRVDASIVVEKLRQEDIQAAQYYRPVNHNAPYKDGNSYPVAEDCYRRIVYLPSSLTLTDEQIDRVCEIVKRTERELG